MGFGNPSMQRRERRAVQLSFTGCTRFSDQDSPRMVRNRREAHRLTQPVSAPGPGDAGGSFARIFGGRPVGDLQREDRLRFDGIERGEIRRRRTEGWTEPMWPGASLGSGLHGATDLGSAGGATWASGAGLRWEVVESGPKERLLVVGCFGPQHGW